MKVFKFGGASVNSVERIQNLAAIIKLYEEEPLVIIISAMGKTTNSLEKVAEAFYAGKKDEALQLFELVKQYHINISKYLLVLKFNECLAQLSDFFTEVEWLLHDKPVRTFDYYYDQVVCVGELLSTCIISHYLNEVHILNEWLDVRDLVRTDNNFRDAGIDWEMTEKRIKKIVDRRQMTDDRIQMTDDRIQMTDDRIQMTENDSPVNSHLSSVISDLPPVISHLSSVISDLPPVISHLSSVISDLPPVNSHLSSLIYITQGFIGCTIDNESTTLGREGSDYTAAVFGNILDVESVSIWKDVKGVMNADPKLFPNAELIAELSFTEVIEMAYYGAQVIHPKTIKPLQNKGIPLHVKCFLDPSLPGTIIHKKNSKPLPPIIVIKPNQALLHLKSQDFSFVGEEPMSKLYQLFTQFKLCPNLIQTGAVNVMVCLDYRAEKIEQLASAASALFDVQVEKELSLLTIRHYTIAVFEELTKGKNILLTQRTKETIQVLYN